jgi:hypothetical protein
MVRITTPQTNGADTGSDRDHRPEDDQSTTSDWAAYEIVALAVAGTSRKSIDEPDRLVRYSQEQPAGVRGDLAAVKSSYYRVSLDACKSRTDPRYILFALGPVILRQTVAKTRFSKNQSPDPPLSY